MHVQSNTVKLLAGKLLEAAFLLQGGTENRTWRDVGRLVETRLGTGGKLLAADAIRLLGYQLTDTLPQPNRMQKFRIETSLASAARFAAHG